MRLYTLLFSVMRLCHCGVVCFCALVSLPFACLRVYFDLPRFGPLLCVAEQYGHSVGSGPSCDFVSKRKQKPLGGIILHSSIASGMSPSETLQATHMRYIGLSAAKHSKGFTVPYRWIWFRDLKPRDQLPGSLGL